MSLKIPSVISPQGFRALLTSSKPLSRVIPLDATWYMPNNPKNGKEEFLNESRIEDAAFFDVDAISMPGSKYPHMLPPYDLFNKAMGNIGIKPSDKVVVYDKSGIFSSPRVAWTLLLYGHKHVYLLDNYLYYKKYDYPLDSTKTTSLATRGREPEEYQSISEEQFKKNYAEQVIEFEELLELVKSGKLAQEYLAFDARSNDRFTGEAPEPRPELSSGHVPSSLSLPFPKVLNADSKTFKTKEQLLSLFQEEFGVDLSNPDLKGKKGIIVMCGSGVTAVILKTAIEIAQPNVPIRVYDGSWTEWAQRAPKEYIQKDC